MLPHSLLPKLDFIGGIARQELLQCVSENLLQT